MARTMQDEIAAAVKAAVGACKIAYLIIREFDDCVRQEDAGLAWQIIGILEMNHRSGLIRKKLDGLIALKLPPDARAWLLAYASEIEDALGLDPSPLTRAAREAYADMDTKWRSFVERLKPAPTAATVE